MQKLVEEIRSNDGLTNIDAIKNKNVLLRFSSGSVFLKSIKVRENENEEQMKSDAMNNREHHFHSICDNCK